MRRRCSSYLLARLAGVGAALLVTMVLALPLASVAQSIAGPAVKSKATEAGPKWSELTPTQRATLKPLERDWSEIDPDRKQKWIEIARKMPGMPSDERTRVEARMTEWSRLSPEQRGRARIGFQESKQVPPQDRQAQWEAYQALSAEQKRQLAAKAVPPPPPASRPAGPRVDRADRANGASAQAKSNIVPNPTFGAQPKPVAPTVVQAQPGATTTLMSKRPAPPAHQQTGLPKIAATPEFVDRTTLLPQRGAQGAAAKHAAGASAPVQRP